MKKTLIIKNNYDTYFFDKVKSDNIIIIDCFSKNVLLRKIKRLFKIFKLPYLSIFYNFRKKELDKYDRIIVFDSCIEDDSLIKIINNAKNVKCKYLYIWNYYEYLDVEKYYKYQNIKISSYDFNFSQKKKILYNPSPYCYIKFNKVDIKYDICYVGKQANREINPIKLHKKLKEENISLFYKLICKDNDDKYDEISQTQYIDYDTYLTKVNESKSILDISKKNQSGLSLRVCEAIFLDKKLITTNSYIKELDFYDESRIFILEDNNYDKIKEFLNLEFRPYEENVKEYYCIDSWVERFI